MQLMLVLGHQRHPYNVFWNRVLYGFMFVTIHMHTRGVKTFPTKTRLDVGMVVCVSKPAGCCMAKPTGEKSQGTRRCIPWRWNKIDSPFEGPSSRPILQMSYRIPTDNRGCPPWASIITTLSIFAGFKTHTLDSLWSSLHLATSVAKVAYAHAY